MPSMNMNYIIRTFQSALGDGAALYAAKKGYQIADNLAGRVLAGKVPAPMQHALVGLASALFVGNFLPKNYAKLAAAVAMNEAMSNIVDPIVDKFLLENNLINPASVSIATAATLTAAPSGEPTATQGYGRMNGYGTMGAGMAGYASMRGPLFPHSNMVGLPG